MIGNPLYDSIRNLSINWHAQFTDITISNNRPRCSWRNGVSSARSGSTQGCTRRLWVNDSQNLPTSSQDARTRSESFNIPSSRRFHRDIAPSVCVFTGMRRAGTRGLVSFWRVKRRSFGDTHPHSHRHFGWGHKGTLFETASSTHDSTNLAATRSTKRSPALWKHSMERKLPYYCAQIDHLLPSGRARRERGSVVSGAPNGEELRSLIYRLYRWNKKTFDFWTGNLCFSFVHRMWYVCWLIFRRNEVWRLNRENGGDG